MKTIFVVLLAILAGLGVIGMLNLIGYISGAYNVVPSSTDNYNPPQINTPKLNEVPSALPEKQEEAQPKRDYYCEEKAKELIPAKFRFKKLSSSESWVLYGNFEWEDGTQIKQVNYFQIKPGSKSGQNVNFYYSDYNDYYPMMLKYAKVITDNSGQITGSNTFDIINLTFHPVDDTMEEQGMSKLQEFELIDYDFQDCNVG